jgi:diadenosine tetraphosphate (Ap4A) HIT family hydrolase
MLPYDSNNIFARILKDEIPCARIYENDYVLAFEDINPQAPLHVLVIPKNPYQSFDDFTRRASLEEISNYYKAVGEVARILGVSESGFRIIANNGLHGGQEVPHFHTHILGGSNLGPMISKGS